MNLSWHIPFFRRGRPNLYIIEDNELFRFTIYTLVNRRYEINTLAFDSFEACMQLSRQKPQIIVLDQRLPGLTGLEAIPHLKTKWPQAKIIIVSSNQDVTITTQIMKLGVCDYIEKNNYSAERLFASIDKAIEQLNIRVRVRKKPTRQFHSG